MINLLPFRNKKLIRREILRRCVIVVGLGISVLVFVQIILSAILFFLVNSFEDSLKSQADFVEELANIKNLEPLEAETKQFNDLLALLEQEKDDANEQLRELFKRKGDGEDVDKEIAYIFINNPHSEDILKTC